MKIPLFKYTLEAIIFLVASFLFFYSMQVNIDNDERYELFLRSTGIFMSTMLLLYSVNCKVKYLRYIVKIVFFASLWHIKDLYTNPYSFPFIERFFCVILITSTIILLLKEWRYKG